MCVYDTSQYQSAIIRECYSKNCKPKWMTGSCNIQFGQTLADSLILYFGQPFQQHLE